MDSFHYRDSVRSPGDRGWGGRDDPRIKDERGDSFYRTRSPGAERSRRRSRSPVAVDRYEPRGRGRDEYAGTRDRDDRARRIGSPPANIDRYVPGQDGPSPQPLTNPIPDPIKLPYQVGFSYFGEWWRANERIKEEKERLRTGRRREPERVRGPREAQEDREKEKAKIQAAYDAYKEDLQAKMAQTFVKQHKDEQWFRERYVPEIRDAFRQQLNESRRGAYLRWEQDLASGVFDEFSLEGIPKSESNGAGGVIEKEEGEATAANEVLGVGDLVPANSNEIRDESLFQPTLLIKTIAPSVSRQNLEAFCREHLGEGEGGFKWLSLSDPNPSKRYHRIGWIMLHPAPEAPTAADDDAKDEEDGESKPVAPRSTAERALDAINGKTVKDEQRGDFTCHVGVHNPPANPRKKALWDLFSAPDRVRKDLQLATELVNKFESDFGSEFNAALQIEEYVDRLRLDGKLQPAVPVSPVKTSKKDRVTGMDEALDQEREEGEDTMGAVDDNEEDEGMVDDEVDDIELLLTKKRLDLTIEYLRRVFNFCFFCVFESDSIHELTRKCPGGHLRRPRSTLSSTAKAVARASANGEPFPSKKRKDAEDLEEGEAAEGERKFRASSKTEQQLQRAYNWVKTFEDKINQILHPEAVDIRKLGGKPVEDAVNEELAKHVKQEDEHKWRCKVPECTKLFKEEHFWRKHVEKRHTEWLDKLKEEFELINAYVIDPAHIAPSRTDANSNGHFPPSNGQQPTGTPRGFNLQTYTMNNMLNFPGFPMAMFAPNAMGANPLSAAPGWHAPGGDERGPGPIRRGGAMGGGSRFQNRPGPYDRRSNPRHGAESGGVNTAMGGRGRGGPTNRWGDGAAGGAAMGPREAVQGRTIKSYEDLDQVSGGGGGELNY
ncbi:hypothetical protein N656DRAFT_701516 [Canariomyces notabilis]|uniref:C2H2-type domain-containing protein n=1 Tax=Canariomyces notabilis TaxID=2074819 RepID=A0AAN6TKZ7_9PEZI|nr:hypothetical protein N656DRAFT_701516 [Canariomyces arenarius]